MSLLPSGACNAHCHVVGPQSLFPYPSDSLFTPTGDAPKEALFALNDHFGLQRCVVVQTGAYGIHNEVTEDAISRRPGAYRGVALLPTDVSDAELKRLDAVGFRGVRFNYMGHLGRSTPIDDVIAFSHRLAPLGWHLQLHGDPQTVLVDNAAALKRSAVPIVIDHIGRVDASLGMAHPHFQALMRLLDDERMWVKVSGCDRITRQGPPYDDAVPFASRLVETFGDRVVWGNDWPHPNHAEKLVDDHLIVGLIDRIAPDAAAKQRLLVDNPQRLYRFDD